MREILRIAQEAKLTQDLLSKLLAQPKRSRFGTFFPDARKRSALQNALMAQSERFNLSGEEIEEIEHRSLPKTRTRLLDLCLKLTWNPSGSSNAAEELLIWIEQILSQHKSPQNSLTASMES